MSDRASSFTRILDPSRFARDEAPEQLDIFADALSPPAASLLFSHETHADLLIDHKYQKPLPPVSIYSVPGHFYGGGGFLFRGQQLFLKDDCYPTYFGQFFEPSNLPEFWKYAMFRPDIEVLSVDQPCAVPIHPNMVYGHVLLEMLPKLYLLALLKAMGRSFVIALSVKTPEWVKNFIRLYFSDSEIVWFDPDRQVVQAPTFIVPSMMNIGYYCHPAMNMMVDDFIARAAHGSTQPSSVGRLVYMSRRRFENGRFNAVANEELIETTLANMGFDVIHPQSLTLAEQVAIYRHAECMVSEHSSASHNALFAPRGARIVVINRLNNLQSRICALRDQPLGIVEPDGGFVLRDNSGPAAEAASAIDVIALQGLLGRIMAENRPTLPRASGTIGPADIAVHAAPVANNFFRAGAYIQQLMQSVNPPRVAIFAPPEQITRCGFFYAENHDPAIAHFGNLFSDPDYRSYNSGQMMCAALPGASLVGDDGIIVQADGSVLADSMHSVDAWRSESVVEEISFASGVRFRARLRIPEPEHPGDYFCGFVGSWRNYAHWITECLPRLYLYRWLAAQLPGLRLLLPYFEAASPQARIVSLLGFHEDQITRVGPGEIVTCQVLWSAAGIDVWSVPRLCRTAAAWLADQVDQGDAADFSERIYLRRTSEARRLANFDELTEVLQSHGFRVVSMETMSMADQIRTMRSARLIVGESSAGLANVMFCRPGARLLEMFTPASPQPAHWVMASLSQLQYGYLIGEHVATPQFPDPGGNSTYRVAPPQLECAIQAMLQAPTMPVSETPISTEPPARSVALAQLDFGINHIIAYGQSLASGLEGWPALSIQPVLDSLMLGQSVRGAEENAPRWRPVGGPAFRPLVATVQDRESGKLLSAEQTAALAPGTTALGETVLEGAVNTWRIHLAGWPAFAGGDRRLLASACGVSGHSIESLSKGAEIDLFNRLRDCATAGRALASAAGLSYGVVALLFLQGEHNNWALDGATSDRQKYKDLLRQFYADFISDIAFGIAGQAKQPAMFIYQTGGDYASEHMNIPQAQLELALEMPGCFMAAPVYPVTSKIGHIDANGYRWLGAQFGKVMHKVLTLGQSWKPLHPSRVTQGRVSQEGLTLRVDFHVPVPPLAWGRPFRAHSAIDFDDRGFTVTDSNGRIAIADVQIEGSSSVRLTLARAPEDNLRLRYADRSHNGRGCLHDSDATQAFDNYVYDPTTGHAPSANIESLVGRPYPLMNWCVAFDLPVIGRE